MPQRPEIISSGPGGNGAGPVPGCSRWLMAAGAIGVAAAFAASLSVAAQLSMLATAIGLLVYAGGALALILLTASGTTRAGPRWALVILLPLPMALVVWYLLQALGL